MNTKKDIKSISNPLEHILEVADSYFKDKFLILNARDELKRLKLMLKNCKEK